MLPISPLCVLTVIVGTNRFAYSGNDPVNQLDPSGLSFLSDLWDAVKGDGSFEATFGSKTHVGLKNFADNLDIGINLGSGNLYGAASGFSPSQALLPDVQELSDDDFGSADVLEIVGLVPTGKLAKPISEMLPSGWKKATNRTRLIDGLVANGARITPGNVVDIRSINGRTVWLETGNSSAGLQHIVGKHGPEFAQRGILETQIPDFVFAALKRNTLKLLPMRIGDVSEKSKALFLCHSKTIL